MASAVQKVTLTSSRDIPFSKLTLSQSNVRRIVAGVSIENLAEDIARRTLLQSLSVRPVLDAESKETGTFEVQAGGRRYRALELLVKQKRMSKTQLVPCIVQTSGLAEEDSLAENVHRENLLGSVLQLSCWIRTDVMVLGDVSSGISSAPAA
jgi:ParB-like chromosome segregation protein Spo0J